MTTKFEELLNATKLNDFLHQNEAKKKKNTL
ncbi:MAG: DUF4366 domain-containing protein, partial [Clostridiales bacterium]|nr:DUF4366 domain-containing protein [Clostridiales bacterium]